MKVKMKMMKGVRKERRKKRTNVRVMVALVGVVGVVGVGVLLGLLLTMTIREARETMIIGTTPPWG